MFITVLYSGQLRIDQLKKLMIVRGDQPDTKKDNDKSSTEFSL